eukprot:3270181-Pleurochrysis_carterae.AAC.1
MRGRQRKGGGVDKEKGGAEQEKGGVDKEKRQEKQRSGAATEEPAIVPSVKECRRYSYKVVV